MMPSSQFEFFGPAHIAAMGVIIAVPIVLTLVVRWLDSERATQAICYGFAGVIAVNEVLNWSHRIATVGVHEFVREYMPLHVCGITVFAVVVTLIFRRQTAYEIAYFWGLVGATNAVVTPQLEFGYPEYRFFQYFIAHGGIVAAALFATWSLGMRPTARSVLRVFVLLNVLAIVLIGVNLMLGSNYMFLCQPPDTQSPFFFLPWPWYLLFLDGVALVLFYVLFIPFLRRKA
ncbi:MAG: TIGR02206 family membrane protein [Gemmatimonadota bacterium]|nr:TIGR02206 family membrane protein [Gemmatimonadota bacterium]MDE2828996.1 TIGR02206 family membrane protein [Gemmatimonadota bacterium]